MLTKVTQTSVDAYHSLENEGGQKLVIARFLISETKHARAHSIQTIAEYFKLHCNAALSETGRVSARLNSIKKDGIIYDGQKHILELVDTKKNLATGRQNEYYWLVREKAQEAEQKTLF